MTSTTPAGPVHAVAVRRHLLDRLPTDDTRGLVELLGALAERATSVEPPGQAS